MKKLLIVTGIIIATIALAVPIFVSSFILPNIINKEFSTDFPADPAEIKNYVFENSEPWLQNSQKMKYFGYRVPSDTELENFKENADLTRRYPETLKALFNPGPVTNTTDLLYFADEIADLGVNTYWVIGEYRLENNSAIQFMPGFSKLGTPSVLSQENAKKMLGYRILLAKQHGFAVILIPDYPSAFNIGRANYDIEEIEPALEKVALELAEIAEEYQIEYFSPVNEYDHLLFSNGYSVDEIAKLEKAFYDELVPKIREIYHGKIVFKCGNVGEWSNFPKLSMKGADLFGVGNGYTGGTDMTTKDMTAKARAADLVSARDGLPWFESEFLVYRPIDQENWMGRVYSTYPMEKTYQEGTNAFEKTSQRAVGFSFMSWTGVGRIRGTAAAKAIKDFYARWKPSAKIQINGIPQEYIFSKKEVSLVDFFRNLPEYYSLIPNLISGKMGPQKEAPMGITGPGGCKGKAECDAYCSKPENRTECMNFSPGEQK